MGRVFDIQPFAVHDGPGIRTTVFLKGCPLQCVWCHNPESRSAGPTLMFTAEQCAGCARCAEACEREVHRFVDGGHALARERCMTCGDCVAVCPTGALELAGREWTVAEVLAVVMRDRAFHRRSGGGMTISGGEPMAQPEFTRELLRAARSEGVHTALDTSGMCPASELEETAPWVDLVLFDVKHPDSERHRVLTGLPNEMILDNLRRWNALAKPIWVRVPLIPGLNDEDAEIHAVGRLLAGLAQVQRVELLRYHRLAEAKYTRLGGDYALRGLEPPSAARAESRRAILAGYGLELVTWR